MVHAVSGTVTTIHPKIRMTDIETDDGPPEASDATKPGVSMNFDKSVSADAVAVDKFTTLQAHVIVYYYYVGDARTLVALRDVGTGHFVKSSGRVVKLDRHDHLLTIQNSKGGEEKFTLDAKTVADTETGVVTRLQVRLQQGRAGAGTRHTGEWQPDSAADRPHHLSGTLPAASSRRDSVHPSPAMSSASANPAPPNRLLPRFAWFIVFYNVLVIVWGALVRASGSGAGCGNHWPLCNGQVIPISPGFHTIIEFTHRMMVGGSTFLILALLVWTFRATVKGQAARALAVASTFLLLNEAFLGALLVKLDYVTGNQSTGASFCSPSTSATHCF